MAPKANSTPVVGPAEVTESEAVAVPTAAASASELESEEVRTAEAKAFAVEPEAGILCARRYRARMPAVPGRDLTHLK